MFLWICIWAGVSRAAWAARVVLDNAPKCIVTASVKASTRHTGWHVGVGVWVRLNDPDGISRDVNEGVYIRCKLTRGVHSR
jgi:hypothetical protein